MDEHLSALLSASVLVQYRLDQATGQKPIQLLVHPSCTNYASGNLNITTAVFGNFEISEHFFIWTLRLTDSHAENGPTFVYLL